MIENNNKEYQTDIVLYIWVTCLQSLFLPKNIILIELQIKTPILFFINI